MNRIVSIISWLGWIFVMIFPEKIAPHLRNTSDIDILKLTLLMGFMIFGAHARIDDLNKKMEEKK